ncbi:hypothetical protein [Flavobacterium sp. N2270]|uniref:hypothetical protein n=1 Tax=Flavobacterium sp. N2270 TaxID=2986831 RepID=UPI002224E974|nr:hypothetical protein [Flavobacterium sp. N2270]
MKKALMLMVTVILASCTTIKQLKNQDIQNYNKSTNLIEKNNLYYINSKIDNKSSLLLFDTGANMTVVFDSTAIENFELKKFGNFGTVTGADGKLTDLRTFTAIFENEIFKSDNKAFAFIDKTNVKCKKEMYYKGVLGLDIFFKNDLNLFLNFSDNIIGNISEDEKTKITNDGYQKIKSKCKSNKVYIYLNINNTEYEFKLDSGFLGNFIIPFDEKLNFEGFDSLVYEGSLFNTATSTTEGEENFYENIPITIGDINLNSTILVSKTIKNQNAGINFIKCFDWVIDYEENSVYVKKNNIELKSKNNENAFQYRSKINSENELIISAKQKGFSEFNLNEKIISINSELVTESNICEMNDLLNKTQKWSDLNIVLANR